MADIINKDTSAVWRSATLEKKFDDECVTPALNQKKVIFTRKLFVQNSINKYMFDKFGKRRIDEASARKEVDVEGRYIKI
jgi:hypothetical protein